MTALPRETAVENALGRGGVLQGSAFGGYGELTLNAPGKYVLDSPPEATIDLRRFVLFFGHNFSDRLRFYSELEVEHAVSSADDRGEAEVEQAYLDGLLSRRVSLRGGLMIMPVGIVNVYHEPPTFNGVDRPAVDTYVIPTTWREPGVGIFGELREGVRYQLYLVNGFNANGFTAETALREGHQEAQLAHAGDWGGVARVDCEPRAGHDRSAARRTTRHRATRLTSTVGKVPVSLFEADARTRIGGFTARAEVAVPVHRRRGGAERRDARRRARGRRDRAGSGGVAVARRLRRGRLRSAARARAGQRAVGDAVRPLRLRRHPGVGAVGLRRQPGVSPHDLHRRA